MADITNASAFLDRLATQDAEERFMTPGLHDYETRRFIASLYHTLTPDPTTAAFLADAAFIWGATLPAPHNRCVCIAVEQMFVADWDKSTMDWGRVLHAFEAWARDQGAPAVSVSIHPPFGRCREHYMRRKGFLPRETTYVKTLGAGREGKL